MAVGDSNLYFSRETRVFLQQGSSIWEIPILQGYTLNQSVNSSEVTLAEAADASKRSRRGKRKFNDSLAPLEWSISSYARPTINSGNHRAVEEVLWSNFVAPNNYNPAIIATTAGAATGTTCTITFGVQTAAPFTVGGTVTVTGMTPAAYNGTFIVTACTTTTVQYTATTAPGGAATVQGNVQSGSVVKSATSLDIDFNSSNFVSLGTFDLIFVYGARQVAGLNYASSDSTYILKAQGCVVNEATINFDIEGITTIAWSGMGASIVELAAFDATTAIVIGISNTNNMIRNRFTQLSINSSVSGSAIDYTLTLTGGSITFNNGMSFLTPETLGVVNVPLGHVVGTRSVSGTFTAYADELTNGPIDLYEDLIQATNIVTNSFKLNFYIGGKASATTATAPGIMLSLPTSHLEIPSLQSNDILSFEANFTALPSNISGTNECDAIRYFGT